MSSPKVVAFIGAKGLPAQAGVDRVVEAIVMRIDKDSYRPVVYVSNRVVPENTKIPGIELIRIPTLPGNASGALSLFLMSALHCLFFGKYDLIHLHNVEAAFVLPILRLRYKVISTSHGAPHTRDKWGTLVKTLLQLAEYPFIYLSNSVTCVAEPLTQRYQRLYKKKEIYFVGNGVETEYLDVEGAHEVMKAHDVQPGEYFLFAAGRIIPTKGCHFLLEAFRSIPVEKKLLIIGNAKHVAEYEQQLHELADERVDFIHFLPSRNTVLAMVKSAGLFIFPSTYEGMSMMLLEVLSLDVPFICSDIPENTKVVTVPELMFESENVDHLRTKLEWALQEPEEVKALSQQAHAYAMQHHHWDGLVKRYESLFAELM